MDSSTGQNNKGKNNRGLSILAGIGFAIGTLLAGILLGGIILNIMIAFWDPGEFVFMLIVFVLIGIVALLTMRAGIAGGKRTYKHLSEKK